MLDVLRSNAKSTFTWVIVIGIVVVFAINFGPGSLSKSGGCAAHAPPYAARVNGQIIPAGEWEREYRQMIQLFRAQAGDAFTRELAEQLGISQRAMDQLVDRELVVQEARRRGVAVTRAELTRAVHEMPAFQENGQFRFDLYEESARNAYGSAAKFEAALRDGLLYQKMMTAVRETVKLSDAEVRSAWDADGDRVQLSFVRFPVAAAQAEVAKPTDADVKAFADAQGARIQKFYDENRARYDQKKRVRVQHILARVTGGDDAAAKKRIEDAQGRLAKGEDFAKVAAALSDDENTKARGGELGWVTEGLFDEAFAKAALSLQPGQVSDPVKSASGWHLVKAEEVVPAKQIPLEAARPEIARELLLLDRAKKIADARAQAALEAARKGRSLAEQFPVVDDAAKKAGKKPVTLGGVPVTVDDTGPFPRTTPFLPKLGQAPDLLADAAAAKKGDVLPKVYETPAGPVVATVTLRETPDPAKFEQQRDQFATRLRGRKETEVLGTWLKALRDGAKIETNPDLVNARAVAD